MMEGLKALGYMLLVGGLIFLIYVMYELDYNKVNIFQ